MIAFGYLTSGLLITVAVLALIVAGIAVVDFLQKSSRAIRFEEMEQWERSRQVTGKTR